MLLLVGSLQAQAPTVQNGVIISKVGKSYLFIFPASQGRLKASDNPAGSIEIGKTIKVMYALKIAKDGKVRFIGLDASQLSPDQLKKLNPHLSVQQAEKLFGFLVKDTVQPQINIHIRPGFMTESGKLTQSQVQEKVARQGNLTVIFAQKAGAIRILEAILD